MFAVARHTGEGYVEMDIPWQLCRTIGLLTLHSQEIIVIYVEIYS